MNPRLGFFRGSQFFHPDLQFKLAFPDGWKTSNMSQAVVAMSPQQDAIIQLQLEAQGTSLESAARAFFNQQGVQGVPRNLRINELPATGGEFAAQTQDGILRGIAAFVSYGGAVYRLMGYTPQQRWPAYRGIIESSVLSFDRLTDPAMLRVQPQHVRVVTLPRAMSLAEFAAAYPGPVSVKELALLNNVDETARFEAGARVKRVVGEQLPKS
jgi:predicted Zn-dependent protease